MPLADELVSKQLQQLPDGTTSHFAELESGLRMHWFQKGSGPVAFLLHGFPELPVSYLHQIDALSDAYTVVVPHLRGYGPTDSPAAVSAYQLPLLSQDIQQLADANDWSRFHLVGHDWGGAIAWELAMDCSERLLSCTVLNSCPAQLLLKRFIRSGQIRRSWYMFLFQIPFLSERAFRKRGAHGMRKLFLGGAHQKERLSRSDFETLAASASMPNFGGLKYYRAAARSVPPPLRPVSCPAQLVWGVEDPALGVHLADPALYSAWVEDLSIHLIQDAGHWVQQEAPGEVSAKLRAFWESHNA